MKSAYDVAGRRPEARHPVFDVARVRADFPILKQTVHGKPLVYLDNAATTQKPQQVIDAMVRFYSEYNSNVHRGVHTLSQRATDAYEQARAKAREFLNAQDTREIIFVRGTSEAINLVARSFVGSGIAAGDEIIISTMEHHSNIVPWQILCQEAGAHLRVLPINDRGELQLETLEQLLTPRTRLVSVTHLSNALGTVNPIREIIQTAHRQRVPVMIDGAQAAAHLKVDVRELDCDFYAISGHKMYGPTGIGVLYGKKQHLESMPPYQGGGDMISSVSFEKTTYNELPFKFEAGTSNIAGAIGLAAAIDYISEIGKEVIAPYEDELLAYGTEVISRVPKVRLIGTAGQKAGVISFVLEGVHPHDIGTVLDQEGIAIRTGHHCAQPLMQRFQIPATARVSLALYNTREEIDAVVQGLHKVNELFN
ncbi:MAG TPA: cysteine desulfurase [Acidobacteriota bacterium]|jgi:cysteine desulfurase/selenocysteine lyase